MKTIFRLFTVIILVIAANFFLFGQDTTLTVTSDGKVGIGNTTPTHTLEVGGTIGINNTQVLYLPEQNDFIGTLILGNGGGNLVHLDGSEDGWYNTAVGIDALSLNTNGYNNTAIGYRSLYSNTTGYYNTAVGRGSLFSNATGDYNTAVGYRANYLNTIGNYNVCIGLGANQNNQEGSYNTIIGYEAGAGSGLHSKTGCVFIGAQAGLYETGDNKLYIENSLSDSPLIWGDFATNLLVINGNSTHNTNNRTLFVNGDAGGLSAWNNDSDERLKKNIITIPSALEKVNKLRGVNFEWKETENRDEGLQMGFIAQEVKNIIPEVVDDGGEYYSMQYAPITALLVEAFKDLSKENSELQNEIEQLRNDYAKSNNELDQLKELVSTVLNKENEEIITVTEE